MKKIAFILFISSILASCMSNKDQFKITGKVSGIDTGLIFLQQYDLEKWVNVDSVKIEKGEFVFQGKVELPELRQLVMQQNQLILPVFVENSSMEIQIFPDSVEKSVIKGSVTQDVYNQYVVMNAAIDAKMEDVYRNWKNAKEANDTLGMEQNDSISNALDMELKSNLLDFVKTNNKTVVSPYLVMRNSWQFELPELEEIVNVMDTSLKGSSYMQSLQQRVNILQRVAVGQPAPDFTMNDTTGKPVTLSMLKGKVLLVDFWASWCGPCRAENPSVVNAYQAYSKRGFDVLGCSFDQNREKWIKAVNADHLTWTQVSDLKGWGNAAGKLYGVNSIPSNVLLDKDQMIIGRNLRGEDLMNKLEEIFGPATPEKQSKRRK